MQNDVSQPEVIALPVAEFRHAGGGNHRPDIRAALAARGSCRLALAGGNTPRAIHAALAARAPDLAWANVWITFGDERCVPPDHAESNYRRARESLLDRVPIPAAQILRIRGELPPKDGAFDYEQQLAAAAGASGESQYIHDLVMLGMGEDGHTASLFPGLEAVEERARLVVATIGPKPPPDRVTMTLPLLNAARRVFFVVTGLDKAPVLSRVLAGDQAYPSARVRPPGGTVRWLLPEQLSHAVT